MLVDKEVVVVTSKLLLLLLLHSACTYPDICIMIDATEHLHHNCCDS